MPRAPRIEYEDDAYHVMARGNRRQPIVYSDVDRGVFAETLAEAADLARPVGSVLEEMNLEEKLIAELKAAVIDETLEQYCQYVADNFQLFEIPKT